MVIFIVFFLLSTIAFLKLNNKNFNCKIRQTGIVIKGKQISKAIGFPTANIPYVNNSMDSLVFVSTVKYNGKTYKGATFFNKEMNILENHILDFNEDIYGKEIDVCLIEKIRGKIKFNSREDVENQLKKDIQQVKKFFKIKN